MKFRIVKNELGYYPQVKTGSFSSWKKIAKHVDGFGLYNQADFDYPKTLDECNKIIADYKEWVKIDLTMKPVKTDI